ncbi:glycosyltransferase family 2 protein, partial [Saccharata proteae CBS 121410]
FVVLFVYRYLRTFVNWLVWVCSEPFPLPAAPTYSPEDVTVICPTVNPSGEEFEECMRSVLAAGAHQVLVSVPNAEKKKLGKRVCKAISPKIRVVQAHQANKRSQINAALPWVTTKMTAFIDDHVFWPKNFLVHSLAPAESPLVGAIGTEKSVHRLHKNQGFWVDFANFIGCLYIERLNFECVSMSRIDGGVPLLPGPTQILRTEIVRTKHFMNEFESEHAFRMVGPLNADDDNFVTRYIINHDWKIEVQSGPEATMEITLGEWPKINAQLLRWARTVWRSTFASLVVERKCYTRNPWTTYALHFASLTNFSLFWDFYLPYLLWEALSGSAWMSYAMVSLVAWIVFFKMVKVWAYFRRNPSDIVYIPLYFLFGWYHSWLKAKAMFTSYVTTWGSR